MSGPLGSAQWMYATGAEVTQQSLKFNSSESQYLSWTPAAAGNRKTWTWSGWVKRGKVGSGTQNYLFGATTDNYNVNWTIGGFFGDQFTFYSYTSSQNYQIQTNRVFRDPSNWYHVVIAFDTTAATSSDRIKLYINGVQETSLATAAYPTQNLDDYINNTIQQDIGRSATSSFGMDGYLSDINFIDGQALDPTDFGQFTDGYWEKKDYAGSYGTNGFHLTFADDVVSEGFNAVTYRGTGASQSVSGLGLAADFVWIKGRNVAGSPLVYDSVRGATKYLQTNSTSGEGTGADSQTSFDSDGFSVGADSSTTGVNKSGTTYVAWAWDAGSGSPVSNTDGSITSTVKANPSYGFSITSFVGNGTLNATTGHGLSNTPEMVLVKNRSTTVGWLAWHKDLSGATYRMDLNGTGAEYNDGNGALQGVSSSLLTLGSLNAVNQNSANMIAYCFHSVAGYSSIGSFSGSGATGNAVTTGFAPAFVMLKRTDSTSDWTLFDNTRDPYYDGTNNRLWANLSDAESTTANYIEFTSTGFTLKAGDGAINASGGTYIYMAFGDTREAAFWKDVSGQGNHWTPSGLDYRDSVVDSPANNFAVLNALVTTHNLSEGNLRVDCDNSTLAIPSTLLAPSGKWYGEILINDLAGSDTYVRIGVVTADGIGKDLGGVTGTFAFLGDGRTYSQGSVATYGTAVSTGDVFQVALDNDNGKLWFGLNGTWMASGDPAAGNNPSLTFTAGEQMGFAVASGSGGFSPDFTANFGQDSTFSGARPAGGNQDDNGVGDFAYPVPAGYLSLCSASLPTPTIVDGSENFNTVLFSGSSASEISVTGVGFQPEFVWDKNRNSAWPHLLWDVVRGTTKYLSTNSTGAEVTDANSLKSFDADGFTVGAGATFGPMSLGNTHVAWNWKAGGAAVSNTAGSITSQVSANTDAGFSIVSWVHSSTTSTIGHGLTTAPNLIILKSRTTAYNWDVGSDDIGWGNRMILNSTAASSGTAFWNSTAPTSSVFTYAGSGATNGDAMIAYCFANTEGYLKAGSYTGNGSTDGVFVFTGGRVQWLMVKGSSAAEGWTIWDNKRNAYNTASNFLYANTSNSELSPAEVDFVSNGFKLRNASSQGNVSGRTYIYLAIMESPLKHSNAR